jgi:hypothetical protein
MGDGAAPGGLEWASAVPGGRPLRLHSIAVTAASTSCAVGRHQGSARSSDMRSRASRFMLLSPPSGHAPSLCRRHRPTPPYGSECCLLQTCTLLLRVCADICRDHDAWTPLGRHGHARACMQRMPSHACCACFDAFLPFCFSSSMHVTHAHARDLRAACWPCLHQPSSVDDIVNFSRHSHGPSGLPWPWGGGHLASEMDVHPPWAASCTPRVWAHLAGQQR